MESRSVVRLLLSRCISCLLVNTAFPPANAVYVGEDPAKLVKSMANDGKSGEPFELVYNNYKMIGNGSFGVVFQAKLVPSGEDIAIKKVLQDKRFKVYLPTPPPSASHYPNKGQLTLLLAPVYLGGQRPT